MPADKLRILMVDDEPKNLTALESILEGDEFELTQAFSGSEALRILLREDFTLIILDVQMPEMDGFEVAELVRERERTRETPIIFITAAARGEFAVSRGYELGAVDYILKPVDADILRYKVAVFAELSRKTAEIRRQADELALAQAFLKGVLEGATEHAIGALDADGRFLTWNEGARRAYGWTAETMIGAHLDALFVPRDVAEGLPTLILERVTRYGRLDEEVEQVRANRRTFFARLTISERTDASGTRTGYVFIARDQTEQRRAEQVREQFLSERIARSEAEAGQQRLQQLIDVLPEAVVIVDESGRATMINASARDVVGEIEPGMAIVGDNPLGMLQSNGAPYADGNLPIERALLDRELVRAEQLLVRDVTTDALVPVLANAAPVLDSQGALIAGILVFQDISLLKDLERQKDEFLGAVSHDLRSPLTVIIGQSQLLERRARRLGEPDAVFFRDALRAISRTARRATGMVNELIDLARLEMNRPLHLDPEPVDLASLARDAVAGIQATTDRHQIVLEHDGAVVGWWDRQRIERAIANVLENAIKYSPAGGDIIVRLQASTDTGEDWAVVEVIDHGVGIPEREIDRIFERFYRATNAASLADGSGIGLTSVKKVIEEHGGYLSVSSAENKGTTFQIHLPRGRSAQSAAFPPADAADVSADAGDSAVDDAALPADVPTAGAASER